MAIPFASMPPHSSHAQIAARFLGCALIIVPLVRGYMSFRPRMDFDGQNHAGRPSQQSYVKIPSEWRRCVWVLRYGHMKMPSRFQSVLSLVVTGHDAVTKCWGTFVNPYHGQGKTISTILTKVSWKRFRHRWYFFLEICGLDPSYSAKTSWAPSPPNYLRQIS